MVKKLPWYLPNQTVVAVFLAIAVGFVWQWARSRPISFDADQWKQVRVSGDFDIRYRMIEDLKARLEKMKGGNFADVRLLLGPPSSEGSDGHKSRPSRYYRYYIGGRSISIYPSMKINNLLKCMLVQSGKAGGNKRDRSNIGVLG